MSAPGAASAQVPLPRVPFLPTPAGDEGLAMSFRAHWSPRTGTSCLCLWQWVFHPGACQVPCLGEVFLTRDSSSLLEGTLGCHLTGLHLCHSWDSPYHKELFCTGANPPGRDALACRRCWGKEMTAFRDALGNSGYHSGLLVAIPGWATTGPQNCLLEGKHN